IRETLTLKPDNFLMRARRRAGVAIQSPAAPLTAPVRPLQTVPAEAPRAAGGQTPLLGLYGSNSGSAAAFARRIAADASNQGYAAASGTLDEYVGHVPTAGAVLIVTASYEGQPTDNAKQFVAWLETLEPGDLAGVRYAVFGCGNRDWARTYQAIPKR